LQAIQTPVASISQARVSNSFSFALKNVFDIIPYGTLAQSTSPVLELVPQVAHVDVHSDVVE